MCKKKGPEEPGVRRQKRWLLLGAVLLALFLALLLSRCGQKSDNWGGLELGSIDASSLDSDADRQRVQDALNEQVEAGMVNIFMNTNVKVEDGMARLLIQNSAQNHYALQVDITENASGSLLYSSPVIPPNHKVERDAISSQLPQGEYDCLASFSILDPETEAVMNRMGLNIKVAVQ